VTASVPTVPDLSRVLDLMASACQAHAKGLNEAHAAEVAALKRAHAARERELLARIRALQVRERELEKPNPARAALVDLLASTERCTVSGIHNTVDIHHGDAELRLPASVTTQQTVLSLTPQIAIERAKRREMPAAGQGSAA
jgi:hypothetical protein